MVGASHAADEYKVLVRRFYDEVWNQGNYEVADELIAPDGTRHDHDSSGPNSPEIQKAAAAANRAVLDSLYLTVEHLVTEGDWVAARWRMEGTHRPTGMRITNYTGQNMWRVKDGKLVEIRNNRDDLLVFHQLGRIPSRGESWVRAGMEASPYFRDGVGRPEETPG
jgi:ketosteroid isomerase-like protein